MATTEELLKKNTQTTGTGTTAGTPATGGTANAYTTARTDAINKLYDAQQAQREAELKNAFEQSLSAQQAAQQKIAPQYQTAANDLATQYERNRRNFNMQAAGSGINTGTASQAALAQNNEYLRAFGGLRASEGEAQAEAARKEADLRTQYTGNLEASRAENESNRAEALLGEYNTGRQMSLQEAQILAQFGDFSGYASLYGQKQADAMASLWAAQNPDLAYNTGRITADQYFIMTGKRPAGYTASGGKTLSDLVNGMLPKAGGGAGVGGGTPYNYYEAVGYGATNQNAGISDKTLYGMVTQLDKATTPEQINAIVNSTKEGKYGGNASGPTYFDQMTNAQANVFADALENAYKRTS